MKTIAAIFIMLTITTSAEFIMLDPDSYFDSVQEKLSNLSYMSNTYHFVDVPFYSNREYLNKKGATVAIGLNCKSGVGAIALGAGVIAADYHLVISDKININLIQALGSKENAIRFANDFSSLMFFGLEQGKEGK